MLILKPSFVYCSIARVPSMVLVSCDVTLYVPLAVSTNVTSSSSVVGTFVGVMAVTSPRPELHCGVYSISPSQYMFRVSLSTVSGFVAVLAFVWVVEPTSSTTAAHCLARGQFVIVKNPCFVHLSLMYHLIYSAVNCLCVIANSYCEPV